MQYVAYFAEELHLSANYFEDLTTHEAGKSSKEYMQCKIIDVAKKMIFNKDKTMSVIAGEFGLKYPQQFSRMFKNGTGQIPNEYRSLN